MNESLYSLCVIPRFFDVIDIDKNIKDGATIVEDEQRGVGQGIG